MGRFASTAGAVSFSVVVGLGLLLGGGARADEGSDGPPPARRKEAAPAPVTEQTKRGYVQLFATSLFGDGLRFNNPYRLATPLGSTAESVSRTAAYADFGVAATLGNPLGFQHGFSFRASFAVEGVQQAVLAPGYLLWRRHGAWAAYGRASVPVVVLTPDKTFGFEGGIGGVWFVRGGIGITGELVGDVFYGAGTREVAVPTYPVLSAELGLTLAYEVLP